MVRMNKLATNSFMYTPDAGSGWEEKRVVI
jgi:hypothetical protein